MCDTQVVVRPEGVLFAKNSDRDPNEAQILEWHPRRKPGCEALRCTWISIPDPGAYAILISRPFWMWGAEIGTNQHGVTIGNQAVFTRAPYAKTGLTGMDLLRLALERAATASEAVEVIVSLLEAHGQGGGCGFEDRGFTYHNSFLVADPGGAFVLETSGRRSAVERVARGARSISNGLTIPGFAAASSRVETRVACAAIRRARTEAMAGEARGPGGMFAVLRDHGDAAFGPRYSWLNGGMAAACMHAGGVLASSQTTASWVSELAPGKIRHWATGTAAPCVSLFKPVRVEEPVELGAAPSGTADEASLWWRHERLHRGVLRDPAALRPLFIGERDRVEAAWVSDPPPSREAFAEGDRLLAEWTHVVGSAARRDARPAFVRRYWRKRERWAGFATS